ncbi:hypothetical protein SVIOM342S_01487 [Streptomyces violaceorubidus]
MFGGRLPMFALRKWTNGLPRGLRMKSTWASAGSRSSSWRMAVHAVESGWYSRSSALSSAREFAMVNMAPRRSCSTRSFSGPERADPYHEASPFPTPPLVAASNVRNGPASATPRRRRCPRSVRPTALQPLAGSRRPVVMPRPAPVCASSEVLAVQHRRSRL